jgi:hypothetical protein
MKRHKTHSGHLWMWLPRELVIGVSSRKTICPLLSRVKQVVLQQSLNETQDGVTRRHPRESTAEEFFRKKPGQIVLRELLLIFGQVIWSGERKYAFIAVNEKQ